MNAFLGVDYGRKHIGVAVADGPLASPLASLGMSSDLPLKIAALAKQHGAVGVIIGMPDGPLRAEIEAFARELSTHVSCPVATHPETLSTKEAIAALRAGGAKRKKLQNDHVYAACLILEDYLDSQASHLV